MYARIRICSYARVYLYGRTYKYKKADDLRKKGHREDYIRCIRRATEDGLGGFYFILTPVSSFVCTSVCVCVESVFYGGLCSEQVRGMGARLDQGV